MTPKKATTKVPAKDHIAAALCWLHVIATCGPTRNWELEFTDDKRFYRKQAVRLLKTIEQLKRGE